MRLIEMLNFCEFTVLLYLTSALTLTATDETTSDHDINRKSMILNEHISLKDAEASTMLNSDSFNTGLMSNIDNDTNMTFAVEGGVIKLSPESTVLTDKRNPSNENANTQKFNLIEQRNTTHTEARAKIVPRKGAEQQIVNTKQENISVEQVASSIVAKPVFEQSVVTENIKELTTKFSTNTLNTNVSNIQNNVTEHILPVTTLPEKKISISESPKPTHKPKPTLTIGGPGKDKPVRIVPTKSTLTGVPRKIDYIVPIVITVVALPLLAATALIMYRRGRDCWDKRHYRRMDFLIDGMYND